MKFADLMEELQVNIVAVLTASKQVKNSKKFHKILEIVLAVGNYLNGGTAKGCAFGFKMDVLLKLKDTKAADNKQTLLHFIAAFIEKKFPELWACEVELSAVEQASRVNTGTLQSDLTVVKRGAETADREAKAPGENSDPFRALVITFADKVKKEFPSVEKTYTDMSATSEEMLGYFGENSKATPPEEFFGIITNFFEELQSARKDNAKYSQEQKSPDLKESAKKDAPAPAAAPSAPATTPTPAPVPAHAPVPGPMITQNMVDTKLQGIRNASVFKLNRQVSKQALLEKFPNNKLTSRASLSTSTRRV